MSQILNVGIEGLLTNNNQQTLTKGSLAAVKNMNTDRKLAESRRGFSKHSTIDDIKSITEYQDKLIARRADNTIGYYNSGWTNYAQSIAVPDSTTPVRFLQANQNLYITSSTGVKVLDSYNGTILATGMPKGLNVEGATTGSTGFMATDTQVAYRVVWGSRDANNNLYLGAPSQRCIVSNSTGGSRDVALTITIPAGITTADFFQVYRSRQSASVAVEPDDELSLVYEANPSSGQISALSVTFTDVTDDALFGASLYTNANQEGISETNDTPPYAKDITEFKGYTFYSNIKTKYNIYFDLLAVSGSGLVADDTITIAGTTYTAKSSTTVASAQFKVFTSGSAAQNIDDTAKELVKVINQYASNTSVYAYYVSEYSELPGQIYIEERTISASPFTVAVSRAAAWRIDNSGTAQNNEYTNGLMWSKDRQPEHVPFSHLEFIGSKSYASQRIIALQDSLFILKEDGVFRLTGAAGSWSIDPFDDSTKIIAPESAVVINNQIYCLSNQGVVTISTVGVSVIGEDIKDSIQQLVGLDYTDLQYKTFGVAYDTDRKYILSTITSVSDEVPSQQFVFNVFTNKWSRWEKPTSCGFVAKSNDKLYFAGQDYLLEERKSFTYRDFIDEDLATYTIVSSDDYEVVLNSVTNITVGDLLYESDSVYSAIVEIDVATNTVTVSDIQSWTPGSATVYLGIDTYIEWAPAYADNGGMEKSFEELQMMFKENNFRGATVDFYTDLNGGFESVAINGNYGGGNWGLFPWGSVPWGGVFRPTPSRVSVPRNKSQGQLLGVRFSCRMAYSKPVIEGYSLSFDYVSDNQGIRNV